LTRQADDTNAGHQGTIDNLHRTKEIGLRFEPEQLLPETMAFAEELAAGPPLAIRYIKQLAYESQYLDLDTSLRVAQYMQTIVTATEDAQEGRRAMREKRPPKYTGR